MTWGAPTCASSRVFCETKYWLRNWCSNEFFAFDIYYSKSHKEFTHHGIITCRTKRIIFIGEQISRGSRPLCFIFSRRSALNLVGCLCSQGRQRKQSNWWCLFSSLHLWSDGDQILRCAVTHHGCSLAQLLPFYTVGVAPLQCYLETNDCFCMSHVCFEPNKARVRQGTFMHGCLHQGRLALGWEEWSTKYQQPTFHHPCFARAWSHPMVNRKERKLGERGRGASSQQNKISLTWE